jgi:hypothetical protein
MTEDLRRRVEGALGKVEELVRQIPGYKGYKDKEMRREADKLLRLQVARAFDEQRRRLNGVQVALTNAGRLGVLVTLDRALMRLQFLIDRLKTASYGYAGLFDAVKVKEAELDALYEFDAALLGSVDKVGGLIDTVAAAEKDEDVEAAGRALLEVLEEINTTFSKRQDVVLEIPAV